jgi:hypothetical protein
LGGKLPKLEVKAHTHASIKPIKHLDKVSSIPGKKLTMLTKPSLQEFKTIQAHSFLPKVPRAADNIIKDNILAEYTNSSQACGIEAQVATTKKDEPTPYPYPCHHQLIKECTMRPSHNL